MLKLNTVMINSEDPKALSEFYAKVLGKAAWENGPYVGFEAGGSFLMIGPHSDVKGRNEMPGRIMLNFETADVKGEFTRIKGLGVSVVQEPYSPSEERDMTLATFEDPDGNLFQLVTPMTE